ncbi:hypothetical protein REMIM1_CH02526 [Rhizobium etli bv. mimosae str. Mim1]|nr:hypothetical protein REMIM1_CH02526 [Rhizobium etli bv. mimosae str. Mim1]
MRLPNPPVSSKFFVPIRSLSPENLAADWGRCLSPAALSRFDLGNVGFQRLDLH